MPAQVDITIIQGQHFIKGFKVLANGEPMDWTGYKARAEIRPRPGHATLLLAFDSDGTADGLITLTPEGILILDLEDIYTEGAVWDKAQWDLKITDDSGNSSRLLQGNVILNREVTTGE